MNTVVIFNGLNLYWGVNSFIDLKTPELEAFLACFQVCLGISSEDFTDTT